MTNFLVGDMHKYMRNRRAANPGANVFTEEQIVDILAQLVAALNHCH